MMRKKAIIDALLPKTRQAILSTILLNPSRSWYLSDLASHLGRRNPSSLQREIESLVAAEILVRHQDGNRVYFGANRNCPVYAELVGLLTKTAGLAEVVQRSLAGVAGRICVAFIHGSVARSEEQASSDIDLLIVGDVGLADISLAIRSAEQQLSRAINASVYTLPELATKAAARNHFLSTVLQREKVFLIGDEHDLARLITERPSATTRHEQVGAG